MQGSSGGEEAGISSTGERLTFVQEEGLCHFKSKKGEDSAD